MYIALGSKEEIFCIPFFPSFKKSFHYKKISQKIAVPNKSSVWTQGSFTTAFLWLTFKERSIH